MNLPVMYHNLDFTEKRLVREGYVKQQEGLCFYCKSSLFEQPPLEILSKEINWKLFPTNFLKYPIHLQHCHRTGLTEGAVHSYCNAVLWQYLGR